MSPGRWSPRLLARVRFLNRCRRGVNSAAGWRHVWAKYDGLFLSEDEEEQARVAYHQGSARWRILMELVERKRDRENRGST